MGQQVGKWFVKIGPTGIMQHLGEKTGVEEVEDGVLNPADILVNREPAVNLFFEKWFLVIVRIGIAQVVP